MPVLNESDIYREFAPPARLRGSVACFWIRRGDGSPTRILPDACTDIVWRPGQGAVVAGPDTGHRFSDTRRGELILGVRFLPGAGGPAFGLPLEELRDQQVELSELGLDPRKQLDGGVENRHVPAMLAATAGRLAAAGPPDRAVQAAALRLMNPVQRVDWLARELGFSERQLRRRFLASVGYGPKTLQRVLRLRRFLAGAPADLTRWGLEAGYADHSHLARECRALTGLTPSQLVGRSSA